MRGLLARGLLATLMTGHGAFCALAQPAQFYAGKTVEFQIGYPPGGGYDVYSRLVARFLGRHIPGKPRVVPMNMPGAGSLRLANWLYNVAPKDGLVIGAVSRGIAFDPLFNPGDSRYDATKFNWIGSSNNEVSVCVAWHTTGITSVQDLKERELIVGGTGAATDADQFPKILNGVLGTKIHVVTGYPGAVDINLAMERGEVGGRCGWSWSSIVSAAPELLKDKKLNVLVQLALKKHVDLPNVPLVIDLTDSPEQKQILRLMFARQVLGRPYVSPPGVPADRVSALRKAFVDTMQDPEFSAEAEKLKLEVDIVPGEEVQQLVSDIYKTPSEIVEKTKTMIK
jgi:tripartite-type tricarboxylate transporter receptor subunit TctC